MADFMACVWNMAETLKKKHDFMSNNDSISDGDFPGMRETD